MDPLTERTPRVVSAVKLTRAAERRKQSLFLAEGENSVAEAVAAGLVREIFVTVDAAIRYSAVLDAAAVSAVQVSLVTDAAAKALSDTVTPPGIVAVCRFVDVDLSTALTGAPTLVAVPVEIGEPGNAGTVIRVADAAGADAVVLAGDSVDPHNGKCVRSSAGSIFHIPVARERSVEHTFDVLRGAGLQILATVMDGEADLDHADDLLRRPTAWLFGNEAHGLSPSVAAAADHRVRIPMHGRAESLNIASAAAICLYASARVQRSS